MRNCIAHPGVPNAAAVARPTGGGDGCVAGLRLSTPFLLLL